MTTREKDGRHGSGSAVQIEIKPGSSTAEIARKLASARVIGNAVTFRVRARILGADDRLKPGVYDLRSGMTDASVLEALSDGPPVAYVTVTIPEGFVIDQIAERFDKQAGIPEGEFTALAKTGAVQFAGDHPYLTGAYKGSLEGYLFPKTYRVREGSSAREVIELMLDQFDKEMARVDVGRCDRAWPEPQPARHPRVDDRTREQDRLRAAPGVVGHPQPAEDGLVSQDRCDDPVRPGQQPVPSDQSGHSDRFALQHLHAQGPSAGTDIEPGTRSRSRPLPIPPRRSCSTMCSRARTARIPSPPTSPISLRRSASPSEVFGE